MGRFISITLTLNLDKLYATLPVFAQNMAISFFGGYWQKRRFGGIYREEYVNFKNRESFTHQQWVDFQTVELRKLLMHAFSTVPFYKEKYASLGFTIEDFKHFELSDLSSLPILTKNDLRQFGSTTLLSEKREKGGSFFGSSGTTGTPVKILYSHHFHQRVNAAMESRVRNWAGLTSEDPRGMIGGRRVLSDAENMPPYYRYNFFEKQTYFSAYHISRANVWNYLKGMYDNKVNYMTGYAMSNFLLASMIKEQGLEAPQMKAIVTSSEKLTTDMRILMGEVYDCKVFDSYSGVENCGMISETPEGYLVVNPDVGILEILDENGLHVENGQEGEIVSTGFLNWDQPLIRYSIGDRAVLNESWFSNNGRCMPSISEIVGRIEDTIVTEDGRKMVRFHSVFLNLSNVYEAQVIQHDFWNFSVNIVGSPQFGKEDENLIISRMRGQLGPMVKINIIKVPSIPRSKNGKFKAVISELKDIQ